MAWDKYPVYRGFIRELMARPGAVMGDDGKGRRIPPLIDEYEAAEMRRIDHVRLALMQYPPYPQVRAYPPLGARDEEVVDAEC